MSSRNEHRQAFGAGKDDTVTSEPFGMWLTFRAQPGRGDELVAALLEIVDRVPGLVTGVAAVTELRVAGGKGIR